MISVLDILEFVQKEYGFTTIAEAIEYFENIPDPEEKGDNENV